MDRQAILDRFYHDNGPCCAGCDWWRSHNSVAGECIKAAPVAGHERTAMIQVKEPSLPLGAGHPFTLRDHVCGDFADTFNWTDLPLSYRVEIGA